MELGSLGTLPPATLPVRSRLALVRSSRLTCGWPGAAVTELRYCRSGWGRVSIISHRRQGRRRQGRGCGGNRSSFGDQKASSGESRHPSLGSHCSLASSHLCPLTPSTPPAPLPLACGSPLPLGPLGALTAPASYCPRREPHVCSAAPSGLGKGEML